ncbi:hypothetical protein DIPPA_16924 [Diplonema papillatum]|nr:hypothetical protein DIPPA_16924 [Diplonema papillatum]
MNNVFMHVVTTNTDFDFSAAVPILTGRDACVHAASSVCIPVIVARQDWVARSTPAKSKTDPVARMRWTTPTKPAQNFVSVSATCASGRDAIILSFLSAPCAARSTNAWIFSGEPHGTPRCSISSSEHVSMPCRPSGTVEWVRVSR